MKTGEQVIAEFRFRGEAIADWARRNGFRPALVSKVIHGKSKGHRGESHRIAVKLELKEGEVA